METPIHRLIIVESGDEIIAHRKEKKAAREVDEYPGIYPKHGQPLNFVCR
ncbi:MAG: hypothetical protein HYZ44_06105 [Bacteroidetes bacterium]|nr:hypothetical protein [Bacteroidota bacterium]